MNYLFDKRFKGVVMGIDEVGRGCIAGPVVAAAVIIEDIDIVPKGIKDSKLLTEKCRIELSNILRKVCKYGIGFSSVREVEKYNIVGATKLAMERAYNSVNCEVDIVLIDGNQLPAIPCNMECIVKGDTKSLSIASASIIAKVERDNLMKDLHKQYPVYNWAKNKGYGTKEHREAIALHGINKWHRKTFLKNIVGGG